MEIEFKAWLIKNLCEPAYFAREETDWNMMFGAVIWYIWKQGNTKVFGSDLDDTSSVIERSRWLRDWSVKALALDNRMGITRGGAQVGLTVWAMPEQGWVKVNVDGARRKGDGVIACGGVVRDDDGGWRGGFSRLIGIGSVIEAELWAIYDGLNFAWDLGFRRVMVESDSQNAIRLVSDGKKRPRGLSILPYIVAICDRDWEVAFGFVCREGNKAADILTKRGIMGVIEGEVFIIPQGNLCLC
ncbi:hypothetical protein GQ457_04G033940 [Hibiscus cannabinus]